jgi:hypothetical protein
MDDRNAPATKGDIADIVKVLADSEERIVKFVGDSEERIVKFVGDSEERVVKLVGDSEERVVKLVADTEERTVELIRDVETKLLNAFYGYAKSNDRRVLEVEGNEAVLRSRLATLETRVTEIEGRLNMPPQQ